MLRKIEWEVQNRPITKNWVLPVTTLFSENFVLVWKPLIKSWYSYTTFILFVGAAVQNRPMKNGVSSLNTLLF